MCNDQEHQDYFVERAGTGRVFGLEQYSAVDLANAIKSSLRDDQVRASVERVGSTYQVNGSIAAARLIHQHLAQGTRS